jgi:spermidine synthase
LEHRPLLGNNAAMNLLGREIYRIRDAWGWICVFDDGQRRFLAFDNQVEQSCMSLGEPNRLQHVYTQAMVLGTLFAPQLARATLLGLGGGSLARALLHYFPSCRVTAVELRAQVAAVARQFFELAHDPRLRVVITDAGTYLERPRKPSDLILADLYGSQGMDARQTQLAFLEQCRRALTPGGVLSVNLWNDAYRDSRAASAALAEAFDGRVLLVDVPGGNRICFAFSSPLPDVKRRTLFTQAQTLGYRMHIPLQRLARNLWFQNAAALQYRQTIGAPAG